MVGALVNEDGGIGDGGPLGDLRVGVADGLFDGANVFDNAPTAHSRRVRKGESVDIVSNRDATILW